MPGAALWAEADLDSFDATSSFLNTSASTALLRDSMPPRHQGVVLPSPKQVNRIKIMGNSALSDERRCVSDWDVREVQRHREISPLTPTIARDARLSNSNGLISRNDRLDTTNTDPGTSNRWRAISA